MVIKIQSYAILSRPRDVVRYWSLELVLITWPGSVSWRGRATSLLVAKQHVVQVVYSSLVELGTGSGIPDDYVKDCHLVT
jgi:hypothetical protein